MRLLRIYAIMTKISPRVSAGPNKHVDTQIHQNNTEINLIEIRARHVWVSDNPFHRMASNELTITNT